MYELKEKIRLWLDPKTIEGAAMQQLINTAEMDFVDGLAVMPDCHHGKGAVVGSVIASSGAISPAAVGLDGGCGMIGVLTKFFAYDLPDNLDNLRDGIIARIPVSVGGYHTTIKKSAEKRIKKLLELAKNDYFKVNPKWTYQLGTLGSGNHFIEVCLDENNQVWVVLHSGSRGIGNQLGQKHIKVAQNLMDAAGIKLTNRDLAYLSEGSPEFDNYIRDALWAQEFARFSREEMMDQIMEELSLLFFKEPRHEKEIEIDRINCHHNFTQRETHFGKTMWITRKGAIEMQEGQRGIIPGAMGSKTYVVSGLGNDLAYNSAPHGAGRKFSRTEGKKRFTEKELRESMKGISYRHSPGMTDEFIGNYKNIDEIIENSKDLVTVEHVLTQVVNVKGD